MKINVNSILAIWISLSVSYSKIIDVVSNINLKQYTGKWFQVATSRSTKFLGTGPDYSNVTAVYNCINDCNSNNISVFNEGLDSFGRYTSIKGVSYCENNTLPSKRKVVFDSVPFPGNYWIVKLGPIVNCKYDYAVVSGPINTKFGTRFSLYVLCRNINRYEEKYEEEVQKWCIDNGFKYYWNSYIKTK